MYVYHTYFEAERVGMVYPGSGQGISGRYTEPEGRTKICSLLPIDIEDSMDSWQERIVEVVAEWMG